MEAIILAGGMGTRLKNVLQDIPKPMAPVGDKPFLYYIFEWIKDYPVGKIILSVGYKADKIKNHFGDSVFDIPLEYVTEEKPLGTGGAVKYALQKTGGNEILIINGDTYFPININDLRLFHKEKNSRFTIALKRMSNFDRYGTVESAGSSIIRFNEKKFCEDGLINGGIYLADRDFIESWQVPDIFSLEKDILEREAGKPGLKGMVFREPFIDIGIPEDYQRAISFFKPV